jgi:hypothetical protein
MVQRHPQARINWVTDSAWKGGELIRLLGAGESRRGRAGLKRLIILKALD